MGLRLENARHAIHDGYPCLEVEIEGRPCRLIHEAKQPFVDAGLVHVGGDFADICPPVTIRPYGGEPQTFEGFSADPRLFALWRRFAVAEDFEPGPVAIPD
jgi:hypothetical protein